MTLVQTIQISYFCTLCSKEGKPAAFKSAPTILTTFFCLLQVLPSPVHQLLTHESEEHGGPAGQLRGHPDELPGLRCHQAAAHQGHTEETVQGDHDGTGESSHDWIYAIFLFFLLALMR